MPCLDLFGGGDETGGQSASTQRARLLEIPASSQETLAAITILFGGHPCGPAGTQDGTDFGKTGENQR